MSIQVFINRKKITVVTVGSPNKSQYPPLPPFDSRMARHNAVRTGPSELVRQHEATIMHSFWLATTDFLIPAKPIYVNVYFVILIEVAVH